MYRWTVVGDLLISYSTGGAVDDTTWNEFLGCLGALPITRYLSAARGAVEPNSVQRRMAIDLVKRRKIRVGLMTDDNVVRLLATAASWLGADIKAFQWGDTCGVLRYLGVPPLMDVRVLDALDGLKSTNSSRRPQRITPPAGA